ncbi:unnamed protein product [Enterobius vermicularis]|uniref:Innexin n=1 Tax=Enterobius vermicularis TaxID=51028 RepID=A0A0N4VFH3_ENTVE|nr:unnamed protein product [Enterobius vermicularis]
MLGIPLINDYIRKVVKPQVVADSVDYLNYYSTSLLLAFFALAISAKQYFGSPIQCFLPNEFKGSWERYAEDYCFIQNSYYIPLEEDIPNDLSYRQDHISYYRWVPIVLALQALMFFFPNYIWNMLYKQTAVQPRALIKDALKCSHLNAARRETEIRNLAEYIADTVAVFVPKTRFRKEVARSGRNAAFLYLMTKFFYVVNIIGQLYLMNHFLGGGYLHWGYEIRSLANQRNYTVQCVIMMNMINEKLYLFLWFWFIFVGFCTLINFLYYLTVMCIPCGRARMVLWNVSRDELKSNGLSESAARSFVQEFLRPDGVLVLKFIQEHVSGRISRELVMELIKIYVRQLSVDLSFQNSTGDNDSDTKHTPSLCSNEKVPLSDEKPYFGTYGKNGERGLFHPHGGRMYPVPMQLRSPAAPYESAPVLEDYIDDAGTLPISEIARARANRNSPPKENEYGGPVQRQITPTQV